MRATVLLVLAIFSTLTVAQDAPLRIRPENAKNFRGRIATVCGVVVSTGCKQPERTTILQLGSLAANQVRIVIPSSARPDDARLEDRFFQQTACASGLIRQGTNGDEITLDSLERIALEQPATESTFAAHAHWPCERAVTMPTVITDVKPSVPASAMKRKKSGRVSLEAVVESSGLPGDMRVVVSVDPELDQEALKAFRGWRFKPGTFMGKPAAVIIAVEMVFVLK